MNDLHKRILVIILGASKFPRYPVFSSKPAFHASADAFRDYVLSESGLAASRENVLWLFDHHESQESQLDKIALFLRERQKLEVDDSYSESQSATDVIIYYVGHGLFTKGERSYCLAIRSTNRDNEGPSSIRFLDLNAIIKANARFLRRFFILDCCFAASAVKQLQSAPLQLVANQILPGHGTTFLCSSSIGDASLSPDNLEYTMFTSSLLRTLRQGHPRAGQMLSLDQLHSLIVSDLRQNYPDDHARPEVHSPDQTVGDLAEIPLFPNPSYRTQLDLERKQTEEALAQQEREKAQRLEAERRAQLELEKKQAEEALAQREREKARRLEAERRAQLELERKQTEEALAQREREKAQRFEAQHRAQLELERKRDEEALAHSRWQVRVKKLAFSLLIIGLGIGWISLGYDVGGITTLSALLFGGVMIAAALALMWEAVSGKELSWGQKKK